MDNIPLHPAAAISFTNGNPMVTASGILAWHNDGHFHREDGPAIIYPSGDKYWCLHGDTYSFDEYCEKLNIHGEDKMMLALEYGI